MSSPTQSERESIKVLRECVEVQVRKSHDYQNPNSTVRQADYYPSGIATIHDIMHAKMLRIRSLIESGSTPNNESIEDSFKDLINYASFGVAWLRRGIDGQDPKKDLLNRPIKEDPNQDTETLDEIFGPKSFHPKPTSRTILVGFNNDEPVRVCVECGKVGCDGDGVGHYRG